MLTLSSIDVQLEYLAEGAANVVYRILPPDSHSSPSTAADLHFENNDYDSDTPLPSEIPPLELDPGLKGKLVRLRKKTLYAMPAEESQRHFEKVIQPLFRKEDLIESELFKISKDLVKDCNVDLREMEKDGTRPAKRCGVYLDEAATHGCLITDMSWALDKTFTCLDFKPKWLVQSPTAPAGSKRCRTCALRAMTNMSSAHQSEILKVGFCPLNLISSDKDKVRLFLDHVMGSSLKGANQDLHSRLVDFLYQNPLLERIKKLQSDLDPDGVFKADLLSPGFLAAMTLRDCSLFLKVPTNRTNAIEARLGDLDLKTSLGHKAEYWKTLERQLIDEGWYTATERDHETHENLCLLSH